MAEFRHRLGDTLKWVFVKAEDDGTPSDLSGATVTCSIEEVQPPLQEDLSIAIESPEKGVFVATASRAQTSTWRPGIYRSSIQISLPGSESIESESFEFEVVEKVT